MSSNKECKEYNTLKYKTMIMTGQNIDKPIDNETNVNDLDAYLVQEMNENKKQPWNKLSKTDKIKKIKHYIQTILIEKHHLSEEERHNAQKYIMNLIDRKKLSKNSELDYDEESGIVSNIHIIMFNSSTRHFTLNKDFKTNSKKKHNAPKANAKTKTIKKIKSIQEDTSLNKIEN